MKKIIIEVETEEQVAELLAVLQCNEECGDIDFDMNVMVRDNITEGLE